jgi:hypothetical protein
VTEINQPLFQKILDQITMHPETHNQDFWENASSDCGTTRCIAGWALHFHNPQQHVWLTVKDLMCSPYHIDEAAQSLLGLTEEESIELFHDADDEQAVELVKTYALKGRCRD